MKTFFPRKIYKIGKPLLHRLQKIAHLLGQKVPQTEFIDPFQLQCSIICYKYLKFFVIMRPRCLIIRILYLKAFQLKASRKFMCFRKYQSLNRFQIIITFAVKNNMELKTKRNSYHHCYIINDITRRINLSINVSSISF